MTGPPRDPILHTDVEAGIADDHPLAWTFLYCVRCKAMVHAVNNECMQTWVETGKGPYCLACFARETAEGVVDDSWGLP